MFNVDLETMSKDQQVLFFKSQGYSEEEIPGVLAAFAKGLITSRNPGGDGSAEPVIHDDPANQDKVRAKEGNARTVPASESNKGPQGALDDRKRQAMLDNQDEDEDDDEDGDGEPDDEEYEEKSFGADAYANEFIDSLTKAAGPDISHQFDASVALDVMRQEMANYLGQLAYETYTLKALVGDLSKAMKDEVKVIKSRIVESHTKQIEYLDEVLTKSVGARLGAIETIAKSMVDAPAPTAATGVVTRVTAGGETPLGKAHGVAFESDSIDARKLEMSERLTKAMTNPALTEDASAALSRLDRIKSNEQLDHFIATRKPELFA